MSAKHLHPAILSGPALSAESADEVPIRYWQFGHGSPAIVLIHGWACDATYWHEQVEALASDHTVVILDLAGHGDSGSGRTRWTLGNFGEDVAAVIRRLDNAGVILVGHSMGGGAMVEAGVIIPERITGLIAVDSMKSVGLPPVGREALAERVEAFHRDFAGTTRGIVRGKLMRSDSDPALMRRIEDSMASADPASAVPSFVAIFEWNYRDTLARLQIPVAAINAEHDVITDETRLRAYFPGYRLTRMQGVGHFPMLESPARFNELLLSEIARLEGASMQG